MTFLPPALRRSQQPPQPPAEAAVVSLEHDGPAWTGPVGYVVVLVPALGGEMRHLANADLMNLEDAQAEAGSWRRHRNRDGLASDGRVVVCAVIPVAGDGAVTGPLAPGAGTVHACPPEGEGLLSCCGLTPFEVPRYHRITRDPVLVTCTGTGAGEVR